MLAPGRAFTSVSGLASVLRLTGSEIPGYGSCFKAYCRADVLPLTLQPHAIARLDAYGGTRQSVVEPVFFVRHTQAVGFGFDAAGDGALRRAVAKNQKGRKNRDAGRHRHNTDHDVAGGVV